MLARSVPLLALLLTLAHPAGVWAQKRSSTASAGRSSLEFVVEGSGGSFEVPVSPTYVTVFYLPSDVVRALASDQENFQINRVDDTVTVRPRPSSKAKRANLNIETKSLRLSILLRVVDRDEDAVSQVFFVPAEEKAVFDRRVAEEVERVTRPLREAVERKEKAIGKLVDRRADEELERRALDRFDVRPLDAIERRANTIIRVKRAAYFGDKLYLFFAVENRRDESYELARVEVIQGDRTLPARARMRIPANGLVGRVDSGAWSRGLVTLPASALMPGQPFRVVFHEPGGKRPLILENLRLE